MKGVISLHQNASRIWIRQDTLMTCDFDGLKIDFITFVQKTVLANNNKNITRTEKLSNA